jgi:hypothetical protein
MSVWIAQLLRKLLWTYLWLRQYNADIGVGEYVGQLVHREGLCSKPKAKPETTSNTRTLGWGKNGGCIATKQARLQVLTILHARCELQRQPFLPGSEGLSGFGELRGGGGSRGNQIRERTRRLAAGAEVDELPEQRVDSLPVLLSVAVEASVE